MIRKQLVSSLNYGNLVSFKEVLKHGRAIKVGNVGYGLVGFTSV